MVQYVSATVSGSQTTDTYGIFGPAGADLSGKTITIYTQYGPNNFAAVTPCGPGCSLYFNKANGASASYTTRNIFVPTSTLIVVGLNDQHMAFAPSMQGSVELLTPSNGSTGYTIEIGSDYNESKGTETYPGCQVSLVYPSAIAFGKPLAPTNTPSAQGSSIEFLKPAAQAGGQKSMETLTFTVNTASK